MSIICKKTKQIKNQEHGFTNLNKIYRIINIKIYKQQYTKQEYSRYNNIHTPKELKAYFLNILSDEKAAEFEGSNKLALKNAGGGKGLHGEKTEINVLC